MGGVEWGDVGDQVQMHLMGIKGTMLSSPSKQLGKKRHIGVTMMVSDLWVPCELQF
jgi:hypothetical protein